MPKKSEISGYAGNWFKPVNVENGPITTIIDEVDIKSFEVDGVKRDKAVVYLRGCKPLICNNTQFDSIATIAGSDNTDDWAGVQITLDKGQTEVNGNSRDTVKISSPDQKELPTIRPIKSVPKDMDDAIPDEFTKKRGAR